MALTSLSTLTLLLISFFGSNLGLQYYASRHLSLNNAGPVCTDSVEVDFEFDTDKDDVNITIYCSTNTKWFAIGFPSESLYFDRSLDVINGYAIVYENGVVSEATLSATNSIIDTRPLQGTQNILNSNVVDSGSDLTITVQRKLDTTDLADFVFDLASLTTCFPLLMTAAMGDAATFAASTTNTYASSYLYLYNETYLLDNETYTVSWIDMIQTPTSFDSRALFDVTFEMDPNTETVHTTVVETKVGWNQALVWGLAFPDVADQVFYATDPIDMLADYSIMSGATATSGCSKDNANSKPVHEWRVMDDGASCQISTTNQNSWQNCVTQLPVSYISNLVKTADGANYTWAFDIPFKTCGYHFTPAEFQSCRPFTITSMSVSGITNTNLNCLAALTVNSLSLPQHSYGKIQIDDFPTGAPTAAPTLAPSTAPSGAPSDSPSSAPTNAPVSPTTSPTSPTNAPTTAPTGSPTARPTNLPTANFTVLLEPECRGMRVKHLDVLFPKAQALEYFNQVYLDAATKEPKIYNQRRVWSNGKLEIYFATRFGDFGDWVVTNKSYSAISLDDANDNNSLVYNTSDPNAVSPNSLPGPYPDGYIYFDHFPHDNIYHKPDQAVTLYFACLATEYPTAEPSPTPTTAQPTLDPTTNAPTQAPTGNCTALCIADDTSFSYTCDDEIAEQFKGCYLNAGNDATGRATWSGVAELQGYEMYYSEWHQQWTLDGPENAAVIDGSERQPPGYDPEITHITVQPQTWSVFDKDNLLAIPCSMTFKYFCHGTGIPTKAPTNPPTTDSPTTSAPTASPSPAPSDAPTIAPTLAPSLTPTDAPTAAPNVECLGLELSGTDSALDGLYRREFTDRNGHNWWSQNIGGDGEIFWSDSVLHESWIIHSADLGLYWLSQRKPQLQPLLTSLWDEYIGSLPFVEDTKTLSFICFGTLPPTPDPTAAPSSAPTFAPSTAPSAAPSAAPSIAPTDAPTGSPSPAPTTQPPTMEPTMMPTFVPTREPTPEPCLYLLVWTPSPNDTASVFNGLYEYKFALDQWVKNVSGTITEMYTDGSFWYIEQSGTILQIAGDRLRPPYTATHWQFTTDQFTNHTVYIDCANTSAPTAAPSLAPTLAPTGAPTSSCMGLYFNNTENVGFAFNTWFMRQNDYAINGHKYWISADERATIEYTRGHWYLLEKDNDLDDEDPVMLTSGGADLLSPPSGDWIYAGREWGVGIARVNIVCEATFAPTPDPTLSPSSPPTEYVPLTWQYCPDLKPYFAFVSNVSTAVYWPMPLLNAHLYDINVSVTPNVTSGDDLPIGEHIISYQAVDSYGTVIECNVTVMVIGGFAFTSQYELCKQNSFHIEVQFNNTYQVLGNDQSVSADASIVKYSAILYDPELQADEQNCYVSAEQISQYAAVEIHTEPAKATFLGIETVATVWEVLVLLLVLCLLALIIECLYRIYREKKDAQDAKDNEQTENLLASQALNQESPKQDEAEEKEPVASQTEIELQQADKADPVQEAEADDENSN